MRIRLGNWGLTIVLLLSSWLQLSLAAVLAIDYGTEWTKAALVKPGIPLQIVLTKDSKRKEQSVVGFKRQERLYGTDAFNLGARFPESTFPSLKTLLGRTRDSDVVAQFLKEHPANQVSSSNRSALAFTYGSHSFTVEELVGMQFANIKSQAEKMAGEKVKDVVLTVPPFWTEQERKSIINAAELAGLKVALLLNDGLAVAIDYATTRAFTEEPKYHLIYDMGAGSTTATVVAFSSRSVTEGKTDKTVIDLATLGVGFDRKLGGDVFNSRLVDAMIKAFRESKSGAKAKKDLTTNGRAYARLLKEASRVKHALSGNTDSAASIESLHEDIDFRTKFTRSEFEELTSDLVERVVAPIQSALKDANLTVDQLDSVILHGGSVRVPFVQKALEDYVGEGKLAKTVNADEAAVMGAIFRGAQLNNQFRVKDIRSKDYSLFPISFTNNATSDTTSTSLFSARTKLGNTKSLTFKTAQDVAFTVSYADGVDLPVGISKTILSAKVNGVAEKIEKLKGTNECYDPTVKVNIKLTDSGLVEVLHSEVQCELREKKNFADKFMGFFGGGKDKESSADEQIVFEGDKSGSSTSSSASGSAMPSATVDSSQKVHYERSALRVSVVDESPTYLTSEQKLESQKLLVEMDKQDQTRAAREEAFNSLEAYLYRSRDLLEDELFLKVSTGAERSIFKEKLDATSEWLFSSESATLEELKAKLNNLKDIELPIQERKREFLERPNSLRQLDMILNSTRQIIETWKPAPVPLAKNDEDNLEDDESAPSPSAAIDLLDIDPKSLEPLEKLVGETEKWLKEKLAQQEKLELWETPVLLASDIQQKADGLQAGINKLLREMMSAKTKSKSTSTKKESSSTTSSATSTSASDALPTESVTSANVEDGEVELEGDFSAATKTITSTVVVETTGGTATETVTSTVVVETTASPSSEDIKHEEL